VPTFRNHRSSKLKVEATASPQNTLIHQITRRQIQRDNNRQIIYCAVVISLISRLGGRTYLFTTFRYEEPDVTNRKAELKWADRVQGNQDLNFVKTFRVE